MLFWAGLRGAVGVALAAGLKGENAAALQTTVLVTVVMTMVVFGGTTGRMIEILNIRTGVDDDDESSDDEVGAFLGPSTNSWSGASARRDDIDLDGADMPYRDRPVARSPSAVYGVAGPSAKSSRHSLSAPLRHQPSNASLDSAESFDDTEVLPSGVPGNPEEQGFSSTAVWRDGQWFNVLDERYLLPVFSNAIASKKEAKKKAMRKSRVNLVDNEEERDLGGSSSAFPSPSYIERGQSPPSRNRSNTRKGGQ